MLDIFTKFQRLHNAALIFKEEPILNPNYDSTLGLWFSLAASFMIIGSVFIVGIVMIKETKKMK